MAGLKKDMKTTVKLSSMKGVSRVIGAATKMQKMIWTFSVLIFFSICMHCSQQLF